MELLSDNRPSADKLDWNFAPSNTTATAANRKPIDVYEQTLARPIFFKARTPFVPSPPQPAKVVAPPAPVVADPGLALGGVMIERSARKAYVFSRTSNQGIWISEGQQFMGWEVRSISTTGARLEQHGRSLELELYPRQ